jgi:hypothetical protein
MHLPSRPAPCADTNIDFLRRYARRMLREARSPQPSKALPIVRRVHAARAAPAGRVTDLYHARETLQLKHMFRTIAVELGYADWDACKRDVDRHPPEMLDRFRLDLGAFGDYEHVWFSDAPSAQAWQREHGGKLVVYGKQAVVMAT